MMDGKETRCGGRAGFFVALGCIVLLLLLIGPVTAQTVTVAASDSSAASKAAANYICDGYNDQVEINAAFNALPGEVGTVQLTEGTFHCSDVIFPTAGSELLGSGQDSTVIEMLNPLNSYISISVKYSGITLRGFTLRGQGAVTIRASQVIVQDVTATSIGLDGKRYSTKNDGMFYLWGDGSTIEDVIFINCKAVDSVTHGFHLNAINLPKETRNIRFISCQAIRCGFGVSGGSPSEWITGYDLQEDNDLYDVQLIDCLAEDNWESGFHFEPGEDKTPPTVKKGIIMTDCVSRDNGQRNPQQFPYHDTFLSGYFVHFNAVLTNCISENNKNAGYFVQGGNNVVFNGCTDTGSTYGWKIVKAASDITLNNCTTSDNLFWGLWSAFADHIVLNHFSQNNIGGNLNYQSMLGWYYDEEAYQYPVTDSSFNITAYGNNTSLPIINQEGQGNTYSLSWGSNDSRNVTPTVNVTPTQPATHSPVAQFQATPLTGSAPLSVSFTDLSTGSPANWSWNFGDGSTSTLQNPQHQYLEDGIETVTLTVSNSFGSSNTTKIITVGEGVYAGFTATPRTITAGQTIQFTDHSSGAPSGWIWNFGDGSVSASQNPQHLYGVTGVYSVQLTASFPGSSDHETKTDYIVADPDFSVDATTGIAPTTIRFTDTTPNGQTAWQWDFGDGTTSKEENPVHLYQNGGNYTVTLTATSPYGTTSVTKDAYIHLAGKPVAAFTSTPQVGTVPFDVSFTDMSTGGTAVGYYWQFGDGNFSTLQNPVHTYTHEGVYTVQMIVFNQYGVSNTSKIACVVANLPSPIADFSAGSTEGTAPFQVQFSDRSLNQPSNWFWQFGDGATSTAQNPVHNYTTAGTYTVSLMVRNSGGVMTVTKTNYITVTSPVVSGVVRVYGQTAMPTDPNHDGLYEDLNGNGVIDFNDVVLFFNQMDWIAENEPLAAFDFNHNGQIDFNDIVQLFNML
ncbi:PKD domain-containing protein [Methanosphaerula palustris]|uniref:Probable pectate lyase C n=1 Tax=Methanosphaerula palustris (strain ATCC BAA-1556 / DSM 19958 / E1-9c) TaxID=521011 RepID=B8GK00_METPE|nr:PKD domain-containing protein [Methanosphaerula palustris]ACL17071.1 PKD domain containing protein [Methanosphaerula palustris E1-9c]